MLKVEVILDREVELNPERQSIIDEFKSYKTLSLSLTTNNFVAPNEGIQYKTVSCHSLFGRDRVFDFPLKWINHIHNENLTHVHIDLDGAWEADRFQWDCCSNESIVYSAFIKPDGTYCFTIIDFLINDEDSADFNAHNHYQEDDIENYLFIAEENRELHASAI